MYLDTLPSFPAGLSGGVANISCDLSGTLHATTADSCEATADHINRLVTMGANGGFSNCGVTTVTSTATSTVTSTASSTATSTVTTTVTSTLTTTATSTATSTHHAKFTCRSFQGIAYVAAPVERAQIDSLNALFAQCYGSTLGALSNGMFVQLQSHVIASYNASCTGSQDRLNVVFREWQRFRYRNERILQIDCAFGALLVVNGSQCLETVSRLNDLVDDATLGGFNGCQETTGTTTVTSTATTTATTTATSPTLGRLSCEIMTDVVPTYR